MRKIENLETIQGGGVVQGFCRGLNAGTAIYAVGVYANLWNPVGWTSGAVLLAANVACLAA